MFNLLFIPDIYQHNDTQKNSDIINSAAYNSFNRPSIEISPIKNADFAIARSDEETAGFVLVDSAAVFGSGAPLANILPNRDGLIIYKVKKGDNLSKIAANFGISLNTILWANNGLRTNLIRPGQEIVILPVSGVLHQRSEGESLESIASTYGVSVDQILRYNDPSADTLIIPGAKPTRRSRPISSAGLPELRGYFITPTTGWNWKRLHPKNAVDIANACGTPVYAAADGLVIQESHSGWNSGYGNFIDIEHPNGVITRYSHTQKNIVSKGDYVVQGDLIAYIGNTGKTHGPTGCHLHFEVHGAKNPFAK